ncbi:Protein arginine N-methyltransferase 9 [Bagarius yarrelli]|uniref:Protein arginine N-methyltransferase 9 n=1 Tax=Bagarius yarrelli TaxID=175774 RepID=A0A556V9Z9_BAGYA|nr:Protein arginine N-methyltransferase 9 [Bagarius yarrelli]
MPNSSVSVKVKRSRRRGRGRGGPGGGAAGGPGVGVAPDVPDVAVAEDPDSFRFTLEKWADELDSVGRIKELFDCYEQALELFPEDEVIINSLGQHLFRMGFRDEAAAHFYKALKLKPDFPEAKENFYRVANWLVERWHFLMLNDNRRNRKYQLAIERAVQDGCRSVLDIGTGTGILGMCAQKAGASEVYACELSKTMYELACEVVSANGMADTIKILHKKSLDMEIPRDIPNRVSLVVTETVDAGLLGEGIVESLIHAWKHLLLPPPTSEDARLSSPSQTGRVIPAGATVFAMAVKCHEIRRHHRLCASAVGGLNLAAAGPIRGPVRCSGDADESSEPYTTERLSRLPGGFTALTEPCRVMHIDFNNPQELEGLTLKEASQLHVPVVQDGDVDALVVWFELHLDQDNSISTGPDEDTCWEQAIYPVPSHYSVKRGDELLLEASCRDAYLRVSCTGVMSSRLTPHSSSMDEAASTEAPSNPELELCSALAGLQTHQEIPASSFVLECSEIALLNNTNYHECFRKAMAKLFSFFGSHKPEVRQESGKQCQIIATAVWVRMPDVSEGPVRAYSSVEKQHHQALLQLLARENGVHEDALEFWLSHVEDDSAVLQRPDSEKLWSAIVLDCVEICGLLRQNLMEKASLARCLLEEGGRIFPERIVIHGMLVDSDALLQESAVQGTEPTLGFNIAPFINQFTVPIHVFLDLSTLECTHLSDPVQMFVLDLMTSTNNYSNRDVRVRVNTSGRVTAIPLWYHIYMDSEVCVSTFRPDSHWKQVAVILQRPLVVNAGDWVRLSVQFHKSSISITAIREEEEEEEEEEESAHH